MAKTYEAMQRKGPVSLTGWNYLDLNNNKQLGDIEKKILFSRKKDNCQVFNFTSSRRHEGVTTVLSNLVNYMDKQKTDRKILLVDANFVSPRLHTVFNVPNDKGIAEALLEDIYLNEIVSQVSSKISLLTCGRNIGQFSNSFDQERFVDLMSDCKKQYDCIFIDSSAVLTSNDSLSTAVASDMTFLIIKSMHVQKEAALKTKALLINKECVIGGVVLNNVHHVIPNWMYRIL
ncbi:MAG: CpsD/CapB family tyrosine-protein kinase [Desulfobacula sp.]|nr:CpsD/CapB family tyrosine-protein kinase [Desulfobacula sp.]MCK5162872.1 CpsD/CapB family tyrosine-protein kinase [Desulfobacula sp.]